MFIKAFIAAIALASVTACGGSASASIFNLFVGVWVNDCQTDVTGTASDNVNIRLTELNDDRLAGVFFISTYNNASCAGQPTSTLELTINQTGTQSVNGDTAVRVIFANAQSSSNDLLLEKDDRLFRGDRTTVGADGYPTVIDFSRPLARQ